VAEYDAMHQPEKAAKFQGALADTEEASTPARSKLPAALTAGLWESDARKLIRISQITTLVKDAAHEAGFELAGIAPVHDLPELTHFPDWIEAGYAGEMKYMEARDEAGQLKRASLRSTAPWARSVIVCAINYNTAHPYSTKTGDSVRGWISRYAWSLEDYHEAVMRRLRAVEKRLRGGAERGQDVLATAAATPALQTSCYVDTGPLVERVYAKYAGVGWIGKNTCILNQKLGSWLFLGVILTSLELEPDLPAPDRCGSCTRCIDACPTDALIAPYQLDSNKCISYLTIEKRGAIPEDMRAGMGRHVFGCDICQDVCPWNRKAPATTAAEFQPREGLVNPALEWLAEMSAEEFREKFRGSPIRRTKRTGLRRNAAIAMGNSGDARFVPALEKLAVDEDSVVAETARWALEQFSTLTPPKSGL
jgi:epoxyqueuosine reductase